jgi:hypothetical protein
MIKCPIEGCEVKLKTLYGLKLHLRYYHRVSALKTCIVCKRKFKNPNTLKIHTAQKYDIEHTLLHWILDRNKSRKIHKKALKERRTEMFAMLKEGKLKIPITPL